MPIDPRAPDLVTSLHVDHHAARAARHCVRTVDSPSPDLRDAVALLTSELITRAVLDEERPPDDEISLRVWMPADVVRVELSVPHGPWFARPAPPGEDFGARVLDGFADRWSIEPGDRCVSLWFEIDRR